MQPRVLQVARSAAPLPSRIDNAHDLDRWRAERQEAEQDVRSFTSQRTAMLASATIDAIAKKDAANPAR